MPTENILTREEFHVIFKKDFPNVKIDGYEFNAKDAVDESGGDIAVEINGEIYGDPEINGIWDADLFITEGVYELHYLVDLEYRNIISYPATD